MEFLTEELHPAIAGRYRVDPTDRGLWGHSAGGHFVVQALLRRPNAFTHYAALSPGLSYNDFEVFALEEEYARTHKDLPAQLFLGAGSAETLQMRVWQIVSQTARFAEILSGRNFPNLRLSCEFFTGKSHVTVVTEGIHRALETFWPIGLAATPWSDVAKRIESEIWGTEPSRKG